MNQRFQTPILASVLALAGIGGAWAAQPAYNVTWLGTLSNGNVSYAFDIDDNGQVTGTTGSWDSATYSYAWEQAFRWSNGTMSAAGNLPFCPAGGSCLTCSGASAISGDGSYIAGMGVDQIGYEHGFYWTAATDSMAAPVGTASGSYDYATSVNNSGDVIGNMGIATTSGFLYNAATGLKTLAPPTTFSMDLNGTKTPGPSTVVYPRDITNRDANGNVIVVGAAAYSWVDNINIGATSYSYLPVVWKNGSPTIIGNFGTANHEWSWAEAVNAAGQVVGYYDTYDATAGYQEFAFLYNNGTVTTLGSGQATDINDNGDVVVTSYQGNGGAFVYKAGALYDLNTATANLAAGDSLSGVQAINNGGQIVGWGSHNGRTEAYLLQPTTANGTDLSLAMTDAPDPVAVGSNLTYTITVNNKGPQTATAASLTDTLPAGMAFVSASSSVGQCSGGANVSCSLGDLAANATATVSIVVTPGSAGGFSNSASVSSATAELNPADNTATAVTTVNAVSTGADLSLDVTATPNPATAGQAYYVIVDVRNKSAAAAGSVVLTDALPAGATLKSISGATCTGTGTRTCNLGSIAANSVKEVKFKLVSKSAGTLSNSASVKSGTSDPNLANNSATTAITVK